MKRFLLYTLIAVIFASACSSSKPKLDKVNPNMSKLAPQNTSSADKTNPKTEKQQDKTKEEKKKLKERQKEIDRKKKEAAKTKKENDKKQRKADKDRKKTEKKQDELIKNAVKEEKKRIEEERKKEKENLLNTIKENKGNYSDSEDEKTKVKTAVIRVDTAVADSVEEKTLNDILNTDNSDNSAIVRNVGTEDYDNTPAFLKKFKKKKSSNSQSDNTDTSLGNDKSADEKKMTTMDKVLYMMDAKNQPINKGDTAKINAESMRYYKEPEKENFVKRTWHKIFPKKVERNITYDKLYKEEPKNIIILYPWNRSDYEKAADMLYIAATKELGKKGYYVYSAVEGMEKHKRDTAFCSRYVKMSDLRNIRKQYDADAVLFITVYRFDNPYWSTSTKAVAHYTMISTKTADTLFARQLEFNYDTPIPPKEYHNKDLELDNEQVYDLGVMEQMQIYAFEDIPYGPYHKKYKKDQKRYSKQQEVKYKINVRPS